MSTRCAPLVSTSSGAPSALKTRLLAIAPTSQPELGGGGGGGRGGVGQFPDLSGDALFPQHVSDVSGAWMHP